MTSTDGTVPHTAHTPNKDGEKKEKEKKKTRTSSESNNNKQGNKNMSIGKVVHTLKHYVSWEFAIRITDGIFVLLFLSKHQTRTSKLN